MGRADAEGGWRGGSGAIAENDFNLNIRRYVDTFEPAEPTGIAEAQREIERIDAELAEVRGRMTVYLKELGVEW